MTAAWQRFDAELLCWRAQARTVEFWWRDDDAGAQTPALDRLLALSHAYGVPLALAAIPHDLAPDALSCAGPGVHVLQHGVDHVNRAAAGAKKTEFPPAEPVQVALARLRAGHARLAQLTADRLLPVLVPPWNRLSSPQLLEALADAGYRGLSRYGPRAPGDATASLHQVNTHVDLIDWRAGRGFAGEEACLDLACRHLHARRTGAADADEPTGWLSHHAVHDEACWSFLGRLFDFLAARGGVRWVMPFLPAGPSSILVQEVRR